MMNRINLPIETKHLLLVMHKWARFITITLKHCTPLYLGLNFCNEFNRQKQKKKKKKKKKKNEKIKF